MNKKQWKIMKEYTRGFLYLVGSLILICIVLLIIIPI